MQSDTINVGGSWHPLATREALRLAGNGASKPLSTANHKPSPEDINEQKFPSCDFECALLSSQDQFGTSEMSKIAEVCKSSDMPEAAQSASDVDTESGVEPDYIEWVFKKDEEHIQLDMTSEQAMATLRYFTSTADRTNMMTKTHFHDLELISELLSEKERDLELAAKIGQSLLQRNKHLLLKMEAMEELLSTSKDREAQLEHDLKAKAAMLHTYIQDNESEDRLSYGSEGESEMCQDEDLKLLSRRCRSLEKENRNLFSEALNLRELTEEVEDQEEALIINCVAQLHEAKSQITQLTDEIAQKFEDNIQQQEEITQLISMVVELQKKQKQLSVENEDLQVQLRESEVNRDTLRDQLSEMQLKFRETYELLQDNQEELKRLKSRLEASETCFAWNADLTAPSLHDSIADEIEESVRRNIFFSEDRKHANRRGRDSSGRLVVPTESLATTSGRTSPASNWSFASDERSDSTSLFGADADDPARSKKAAKKLQIVKPLEGSETLHKWHHLASFSAKSGLSMSTVSEGAVRTDSVSASSSSAPPATVDRLADAQIGSSTDTEDEGGLRFNARHSTPERPVTILSGPDAAAAVMPGSTDSSSLRAPASQGAFVRAGPQPAKSDSHLEMLSPGGGKRTIVTRNSAALKAVRDARRMLTSDSRLAEGGKSKADVIDLIANAMSKVNVEAQTGQRILQSLSASKAGDGAHAGTHRSEYPDMPTVTRVLEKSAQARKEMSSGEGVHGDQDAVTDVTSVKTSAKDPDVSMGQPGKATHPQYIPALGLPLARVGFFSNPLLRGHSFGAAQGTGLLRGLLAQPSRELTSQSSSGYGSHDAAVSPLGFDLDKKSLARSLSSGSLASQDGRTARNNEETRRASGAGITPLVEGLPAMLSLSSGMSARSSLVPLSSVTPPAPGTSVSSTATTSAVPLTQSAVIVNAVQPNAETTSSSFLRNLFVGGANVRSGGGRIERTSSLEESGLESAGSQAGSAGSDAGSTGSTRSVAGSLINSRSRSIDNLGSGFGLLSFFGK